MDSGNGEGLSENKVDLDSCMEKGNGVENLIQPMTTLPGARTSAVPCRVPASLTPTLKTQEPQSQVLTDSQANRQCPPLNRQFGGNTASLPQPGRKGVVKKVNKHQGTNLHHDEHLQQVDRTEQGSKTPQQAVQAKRSLRHAGLVPSHVTDSTRGPNNRAKEYRNKEEITSLMINGRQPITDQGWDEGREDSVMSMKTTTTMVDKDGRAFSCSPTQPTNTTCFIWNNKVQVKVEIVVKVTAYLYLRVIAFPMSSNRGQSPKSSLRNRAGDDKVEVPPTQFSSQQGENDGSSQEYYREMCLLIMKTVFLSCLLSSSYATYLKQKDECDVVPQMQCMTVDKSNKTTEDMTNKLSTTLSVEQRHPNTKKMCEKVHYTVKSREVTNQEPKEHCIDVVDRQCHTKHVEKWTGVHEMDSQELPEVDHRACWDERQTCNEIPRNVCEDVPKEECREVPREQCHQIQRKMVTVVTENACTMADVEVCRPVPHREVQDEVTREHVDGHKPVATYRDYYQKEEDNRIVEVGPDVVMRMHEKAGPDKEGRELSGDSTAKVTATKYEPPVTASPLPSSGQSQLANRASPNVRKSWVVYVVRDIHCSLSNGDDARGGSTAYTATTQHWVTDSNLHPQQRSTDVRAQLHHHHPGMVRKDQLPDSYEVPPVKVMNELLGSLCSSTYLLSQKNELSEDRQRQPRHVDSTKLEGEGETRGTGIQKTRQDLQEVHIDFNEDGSIKVDGPPDEEEIAITELESQANDLFKTMAFPDVKDDDKHQGKGGSTNSCQVKVPIFEKFHRFVIGKGGANIRRTRDETDTKVDLPVSVSDSNMVTITGKKESITPAVSQVQQIQSKVDSTAIGAGSKLIQSNMSECEEVAIKFPENSSGADLVAARDPVDDVESAVRLLGKLSDDKQPIGISLDVDDCPEYFTKTAKEIKIPARIHNTAIRAGGKLIRFIMTECGGVAIKFRENGFVTNFMTVHGPVDDVEKAVKLLKELSDEKQPSGISVEVKAKPQHHKFLIGKAQAHIQKSRDVTVARIIIPGANYADRESITITGAKEAARVIVEARVKELNNMVEDSMTVDTKHHRHFVAGRGEVLKRIGDEFSGVVVSIPRDRVTRDKVNPKGARNCINAAIARMKESVKDLEDMVTIDCEIEQPDHMSVMGAKGSEVQKITTDFNVQTKFPDNDIENGGIAPPVSNGGRSSNPNIIRTTSKKESCEKAANILQELVPIIAEVSVPYELHKYVIGHQGTGEEVHTKLEAAKNVEIQKSFEVSVEVYLEYHPEIIGRGGEVTKKLREDSSVQIQLPKNEEEVEVVTITDGTNSSLCARNIIPSSGQFIEVSTRGSTAYATASRVKGEVIPSKDVCINLQVQVLVNYATKDTAYLSVGIEVSIRGSTAYTTASRVKWEAIHSKDTYSNLQVQVLLDYAIKDTAYLSVGDKREAEHSLQQQLAGHGVGQEVLLHRHLRHQQDIQVQVTVCKSGTEVHTNVEAAEVGLAENVTELEAGKEIKIKKSFKVTVEVYHKYPTEIIGRGREVIKKLSEDLDSEVVPIIDVASLLLCVRNFILSSSLSIGVSNRGSTAYTTANRGTWDVIHYKDTHDNLQGQVSVDFAIKDTAYLSAGNMREAGHCLRLRVAGQGVGHEIPLHRHLCHQQASLGGHFCWLSEGLGMMFAFDYQTMPVVEIMEPYVLSKLMEYPAIPPTTISIEEFMSMGGITEEDNFTHLKMEVAVRLAHRIMELQHLPRELHAEERCHHTISLYSKSFCQIIEFEEMEPDQETLAVFRELLVIFREGLNIPKEEISSRVFTSIKTFLGKLYNPSIFIQPNASVTSVREDTYDDAIFHTVNCYMVAKDLVLQLEGEDSQDSDIFMHGKSWERSVDTSEDINQVKGETVEIKDEEEVEDDDYESEDDKYYDNKKFERKECDIVLESFEESRDSEVLGSNREKVSDESKDSDEQEVSSQRDLESEKSKEVTIVDDDNSKDCEVIVDTSEDEVDKATADVEELDESDDSEDEVKELHYSWAPQGKMDKYERQEVVADEIRKLVAEETVETSVEVFEDGEESVVIEDEVEEVVSVEEIGQDEAFQENVDVVDDKSKISTIDLDESAEEKVTPQLNFSSDDDSMEVDDEVIEIESDDEEEEVDEQEQQKADNTSGKAVFSSLFSQSSHESDEELEVSNVDDIKSKVAAADGPNDEADDLVIVEDSSNSTEVPAPAAETGSVLFSTFGKVTADDLVVEEFSTVEEKSQVKETNVEESRVKESEPHADVDELLEGSEESEPEVSFEEDPVYYEEQEPFDLEADFYSPGAQAQKAAVSKSQATSGSAKSATVDPHPILEHDNLEQFKEFLLTPVQSEAAKMPWALQGLFTEHHTVGNFPSMWDKIQASSISLKILSMISNCEEGLINWAEVFSMIVIATSCNTTDNIVDLSVATLARSSCSLSSPMSWVTKSGVFCSRCQDSDRHLDPYTGDYILLGF